MQPVKKRILFVAEAVTLAHIVRPAVLADTLDRTKFDVHFACDTHFDFSLQNFDLQRWPLDSISPSDFLAKLAAGQPLYAYSTLQSYVDTDIQLIREVSPDLIIGDFRLSLAVSAPLAGIPYIALANAHWSPYAEQSRFPVPEIPPVKILGPRLMEAVFNLARPLVFRQHAVPLNRLRKEHRLPRLGDLRAAYTHGDFTFYLDVPQLIPTTDLPDNHVFIGPVTWAPDTAPPDWWDKLDTTRRKVYLTLGSSGKVDGLPIVVEALRSLRDIDILIATAGRTDLCDLPKNCYLADYLPGDQAAARSDLVICNGGSATVYQALREGTPVLGIAANMDQHLTMGYVQSAGAGCLIRSDALTAKALRQTVHSMLGDQSYRGSAGKVAEWFGQLPVEQTFPAAIDWVLDVNFGNQP